MFNGTPESEVRDAALALKAEKINPSRGCIRRFPRAILAVAALSKRGAEKYDVPLENTDFLRLPDAKDMFEEAGLRHLLMGSIDGPFDPDFGMLHKQHRAWDALADLERELLTIEREHGINVMMEVIKGEAE